MGAFVVAILRADAREPRPALQGQDARRRGTTCRRRCATRSCTASDGEPIAMTLRRRHAPVLRPTKPFEGVIPNMERRWRETDSRPGCARSSSASRTRGQCEACDGARLKPEALAVKIAGLQHQRGHASCRSATAANWFAELDAKLTPKQREIAARILKEINERLGFLDNVGLDYLTLTRASGTLVGRREPAHPAGLADRLGPDRRALRARRAVDRPAPARQRPAARRR